MQMLLSTVLSNDQAFVMVSSDWLMIGMAAYITFIG
jgi:hypothetical protein